MPKATRKAQPAQKKIEQYAHTDKDRPNNPLVGFVTPETDRDGGKKKYANGRIELSALLSLSERKFTEEVFEYSSEHALALSFLRAKRRTTKEINESAQTLFVELLLSEHFWQNASK